jgi:sulfatase maturation enzyme AslB (radical SAM superfamily)
MNDEMNTGDSGSSQQGLHIVTRPMGPACNLDFAYCFSQEKQAL